MKPLLVLILLAGATLACPAPREYPKGKPFLECPYKLTTEAVGTHSLQIWHYKMSPTSLIKEWETLLREQGYKVERLELVGSKGVPLAAIRASKGTTSWTSSINSDGSGSRLELVD